MTIAHRITASPTLTAAPAFDHAPERGRWSMIAYEGGQRLEYNFGAGSLKSAIREANDMTYASERRRFVLRDSDGVTVRDQAWNPMLGVNIDATMRAIRGEGNCIPARPM